MIHHNLESGDDFSAGKSVTEGKILIQIGSDSMRSQTRGVFTVKEAKRFVEEVQKVIMIVSGK